MHPDYQHYSDRRKLDSKVSATRVIRVSERVCQLLQIIVSAEGGTQGDLAIEGVARVIEARAAVNRPPTIPAHKDYVAVHHSVHPAIIGDKDEVMHGTVDPTAPGDATGWQINGHYGRQAKEPTKMVGVRFGAKLDAELMELISSEETSMTLVVLEGLGRVIEDRLANPVQLQTLLAHKHVQELEAMDAFLASAGTAVDS